LLAAAIGACADIFHRLPANGYGLCSGSSNGVPDEAGVLPLTDWLHQLFQEIAGKEPGNDPVIFGELWNQDRDENAERDIDPVLMTTNVTRGISQRFPFLEGSWGQLFFRKEYFYLLFPASVVDWLWEHADAPRHADKVEVPSDFRPLRKAANLPIILGARMSLSFPFLLSAVPLYAANVAAKRDGQKIPLEKCWFSDGGLTSNFPIHFFDAPLPSRPTFGINLVPESVGVGDLSEEGHGQGITGFKPGGDPIEQPVDARWKNI
jgi:hypothetical protein